MGDVASVGVGVGVGVDEGVGVGVGVDEEVGVGSRVGCWHLGCRGLASQKPTLALTIGVMVAQAATRAMSIATTSERRLVTGPTSRRSRG
ncbi:hypothetical protein [Nocardioides gansuensis]|uniref:hypothetical protein n=1 Tax=Nocardioides gansuensis TaxID=2138300 RepID=UPI0014035E50|nr:hypothetical protein [Nocardioides gansuensis]